MIRMHADTRTTGRRDALSALDRGGCAGRIRRNGTAADIGVPATHGFNSLLYAAWRSVKLIAFALPTLVGLTGCADDAFLVRDASPVRMPVPGTPSAVQAEAQASMRETAMNSAAVEEGQTRRYFAAIGRVVLANHAGDDFLSSPDIFVQVQRRDPEVLGSIRRAENRLSELAVQRRAADEELQPLREKQRNSEVTPGEPLSPTQVARLDELSRRLGNVCGDSARRASCNMCSRYDERPVCVECEACNEQRFLSEKKAESEVVPGPELTPDEHERLRELEGASARIASDRQNTQQDIERLWDAITGDTHTITTPGYVLDFGGRAIQEVFPGDDVWIAVYDRDIGEHDLYGSTALRMGDTVLRGGDVELAMPNVESLILRIVSP